MQIANCEFKKPISPGGAAPVAGERASVWFACRNVTVTWCLFVVFALGYSLASVAEDYDPTRFEKEVIVPACTDPVQCEITADGRVYFIQRAGALKSVEAVSKKVVTLGTVPVEM